ncbi:AIM24 family protein [Streptomyces sp. NPDC127033]|uniref:AIM24 family protein n=1 Tax=Streptomyces sp. NPDC127033 TaxID=3347110 RepID=UPI0036462E8D
MKSDLFSTDHMAQPATAPGMTLQNVKSIKYVVDGEMYARQGAMVAYRGSLQFERKGQGGLGGLLKRAVTGEGLPLMAVKGQGEVWFAKEAANCFIVDIDQGDALTINGRHVLCFDPTLSYEITTVKGAGMTGGGLFNSVFSGYGKIGVICEGTPIVIPVTAQAPVYVDTDAVVGWSTQLDTSLHRSQSVGSAIRGGSGEAVQLMLQGEGFVIVRPTEGMPPCPAAHGGS